MGLTTPNPYRCIGLVCGTLLLTNCARDATAPVPIATSRLTEATVGAECELGCNETDPYPAAPGIFLGALYEPEFCFSGSSDADFDGRADFCEEELSSSFAPQLYFWNSDYVDREPYWAARRLTGDKVRVAYLLSYYRDQGNSSNTCNVFNWFEPSCGGHNGDSELIALDIYFNASTRHWVLDAARYSKHGNFEVYSRGNKSYPIALEYPSRLGWYPRSYVAQGKHANYATRDECNRGGGFFGLGTDTCENVNTGQRVAVAEWWNLGSRGYRFIDCVEARSTAHPEYGSGRQECYWTVRNFRGWWPTTIGGWEADPYSGFLEDIGF